MKTGGLCAAILLMSAAVVNAQTPRPQDEPALYPMVRNGKMGFIDRQGRVVIAPQFDPNIPASESSRAAFAEGLEPVSQGFLNWGYIDRQGQVRIPFNYSQAQPFHEGLAAVRTQQGYGYIDHAGKLQIPGPFDQPGNFSDGLASVMRGGKMGYIDKSGTFVIPLQFASWAEWCSFSEGLAAVQKGDLWGFLDKTGGWAVEPRYKEAGAFRDGLAVVSGAGGSFYVDHSGKTVAGPFFLAWQFSEGLARVQQADGGYAFIDRTGAVQFAVDRAVWWVEPFSEGLARVSVRDESHGERYGFIDHAGHLKIAPSFEFAGSFHNGLAFVSQCGQTGYIDREGKVVWGIRERGKSRVAASSAAPPPSVELMSRELLARVVGTGEFNLKPQASAKVAGSGGCSVFGSMIWSVALSSRDSVSLVEIALLEGGTFLTEERIGNLTAMQKSFPDEAAWRRLDPAKGLVGYTMVGGVGPGGEMVLASVFSPGQEYEVLVTVSSSAKEARGLKQVDERHPLDIAVDVVRALFPGARVIGGAR